MSDRVTFRAHAKVNPILRVLGKRPDGYHELETILQALEIGDRVSVSHSGSAPRSIEVLTTGPFATRDIVDGDDHLAVRGARLAREVLGLDAALRVEVEKFVPSRAGLGGGSADAAAAAAATLALLDGHSSDVLERHDDAVARGLAAIGSDCAFFWRARSSGAALVAGRGEKILPIVAASQRWVALVVPECVCATPDVYRALAMEFGAAVHRVSDEETARSMLERSLDGAQESQRNDLWAPARKVADELQQWDEVLERSGSDHYLLAGSGSALFSTFDSESDARASLESLLEHGHDAELDVRLATITRTSKTALTREEAGA